MSLVSPLLCSSQSDFLRTGVGVDTEEAAEDTRVSAAAPARAELVVATAELGSVGLAAAIT